jgi:hypothetical protein
MSAFRPACARKRRDRAACAFVKPLPGGFRPTTHKGGQMPIRYLEDQSAFHPEAIDTMSRALEEACKALHINGQAHDREVIATRIIDLARSGVIDAKALSERVIAEAKALRSL